MNNQKSSEKQRFLQFGLRQLLVLVAVLSILFAIVGPRIRKALHDEPPVIDQQESQAALEAAVRNGDFELARRAIEAGANPNRAPYAEKDLLCMSIANGQIKIMKLLLDHGASLDRNKPLLAAIECTLPIEVRLEMLRVLLPLRVDTHPLLPGSDVLDAAVRSGDAAIGGLLRESGVECGPRMMAAFNWLDELRRAVEENPNIVRERFEPVYASRPGQGATLLGIALFRGHREMALYLIQQGAPLDTTERLGATHLHSAARGGDPELIRLLAARGLDVNARDDYGDTPLTDSVWNTTPEAIEALIQLGADVNAQGMNKRTALFSAAQSGRAEVVSMLLAAGADPTIENVFGKTAIDAVQEKIDSPMGGESTPSSSTELERQKRTFREIQELLAEALR